MTDAADSYRPVPAQVDLPALEHEVLERWRREDVFAESLRRTAGAPRWTFYEGPPTANGRPGVHHVEARVFKDVFPRYQTMRGRHVERKAGWDCQGLHVEVGVEKELGISGRREIEAYGVAAFNERCRASVERHIDDFEQMTDRMGYWVDTENPYRTMDATYIESVWWSLKQVFDTGLLVEDQRVAPYCPRCETGLSDHELAQGYETVVDPSVYVRFPLTSGPWAGQAALLVWTTTPWTLVSNTAVAVRPDVSYALVTDGREHLVVAEPLVEQALGDGWQVLESVPGAALEHWTYQRPFELVAFTERAHYVVLAEYVTTDDGTGLVHQSPAFGADDLAVAKAYALPIVNPVGADGRFLPDVPLVGGDFFKHADARLVDDLQQRGLLARHVPYEHTYPHCWRCHTPLLYYALPSWYVRTTQVKDALLEQNARTVWHPASVRDGRFGDWLNNNVDWALSRSRYWGTPLPIWRCAAKHLTCVGSLAELSTLSGSDHTGLDPHRPFVDEVVLPCPTCGEEARRVPEVIDAWYDSGAMPFAQEGYPHVAGSVERFEQAYPAQFICEAIDQTRGWFYSLMAIGTTVFGRSSYEEVVCLGHILAEDGRKMSKHLGNILEPMPLMEQHGADALRWFMACSGSPWSSRRVGHGVLTEIVRKVLLTYWNTVAFQVLYARAADWSPSAGQAPHVAERHVLDRWLAAETATLVRDVTAAMDSFDTQRTGQLLATFIDDLSNWYVRRSRRRFWAGDPGALATLHDTLHTLTRLLAPLVPFVTERVWRDLVASVDPDATPSVHLADWPLADGQSAGHDRGLGEQVALARRLTELGRAARAEAKVRTRQPLARVLVGSAAYSRLPAELRADVCEELNVDAMEPLSAAGADLVDHTAKANFRALGRRFGPRTPEVARAVAAADAGALAADLAGEGTTQVDVDGELVTLSADEVVVAERPRAGWSVVNEQGETVALDLELTEKLRSAGHAREAIRLVQEARKSSGFDVTDRIELTWAADGLVAEALATHETLVAEEVLATAVHRQGADEDVAEGGFSDAELGLRVWVHRV